MIVKRILSKFAIPKSGKAGYNPMDKPKLYRLLYKGKILSFHSYGEMTDWWMRHGLYMSHQLVEVDREEYVRKHAEVRTLNEQEMQRVLNDFKYAEL